MLALSSPGQNLVPNPSFEPSKKTPPSRDINLKGGLYHPLVDHWYTPTPGTSDFYNSDQSTFVFGRSVKKARSGQGRVGMIVNSKQGHACEYIQARLTQPLKANAWYCVTIHYALDKRCRYYVEKIGACFTPDTLKSRSKGSLFYPNLADNVVLFGNDNTNKATLGWQEDQQIYQAFGGEEFITIGNFAPSYAMAVSDADPVHDPGFDKGLFGRMAYYYIDDVSVVEIPDTGLCHASLKPEPPAMNHFVFVVDVSSSMQKAGYLSEMKNTVERFTDTLGPNDLVSLVAFDLRTHVLLEAVPAKQKSTIVKALNDLVPGTVTNVDKAISISYALMDKNMISDGNNRLVLVSDAKFNLSGISQNLIRDHYTQKGILFSVIQFGDMENKALQKMAGKTNGVYAHTRQKPALQVLAEQVRTVEQDDYTPDRYRPDAEAEKILMRAMGIE